jgi:tetratricopeptide (TPR) repeat protein
MGAIHEARVAIALDPLASDYRLALAAALRLQQHGKQARKEIEAAIELDPQNAAAHLALARLVRHSGERDTAAQSLERASALSPDDEAVLAEVGYLAIDRHDLPAAEAAARAVLSINPGDTDGLILMGRVMLARNETDEALRLALNALNYSPTDIEALSLLASAKMKKSWFGGLWWRWNRFLIRLGESRAIFVIVGIWVVYRWTVFVCRDAGLPDITETMLTAIYLAFVIYTISANIIVERMVRQEISRVRLNPSF